MNARTLAITSSTALALICALWAYTAFWVEGQVVCSAQGGGLTYKIHRIPFDSPLQNDGYMYALTLRRVRIPNSAGKKFLMMKAQSVP